MKVILSAGTLVEIQKLSASENPVEESGSWDTWVPGAENNSGSLPVGYAIRGILMETLRVGECLHVYRIERNGARTHGHFHSTPIISIKDEFVAETFNSIYWIMPVKVCVGEEI